MELDKLTFKEKRDLAIQNGLKCLPYIGAVFSTYFDCKQEIRFKRIESFYENLAERMSNLEGEFKYKDIVYENKEQITHMIEKLNDEIEREISEKKRKYYENFFISFMSREYNHPRYDPNLYFYFLKELSENELFHLTENTTWSGSYLSDRSRSTVLKLYNLGLLEQEKTRRDTTYRPNTSLSDYDFKISSLGKDFKKYCLSTNDGTHHTEI